MKRVLFFLLLSLVVFTGCTSVKKMTFAGGADLIMTVTDYPEFTVEKGDQIYVRISALDSRTVEPYNSQYPYYVNKNGYIQVPMLDSIYVVGKTLEDVKDLVMKQLLEKVEEPFVQVSFASATITVLGEVKSPQQIKVTRPITIFEAVGAANGLTKNACYTQVEVLRAIDHEVRKSVVDLTSSAIVQSPCYFLQKGDVVNVRPLHSTLAK